MRNMWIMADRYCEEHEIFGKRRTRFECEVRAIVRNNPEYADCFNYGEDGCYWLFDEAFMHVPNI